MDGMNLNSERIKIWTICIALSAMVHCWAFFPLGKLGNYNFARPVNLVQAVMVDLQGPDHAVDHAKVTVEQKNIEKTDGDVTTDDVANHAPKVPTIGALVSTSMEENLRQTILEQTMASTAVHTNEADSPNQRNLSTTATMPAAKRKTVSAYLTEPPLRTVGEFLTTEHEKLTYQISMFGLPVGGADLEAKNEHGEVRISLKVTSNAALSALYPVDDLIETRHIGGNFIITKIRQQEGSFFSNRGFTLFLRDRKVFWHNLLTHKSSNETVPTSDVLDLLSGFYYLRGKPLKVGTSEILQVYDSDQYTEIPVQVLRRERVNLPGFRKADTIVIKPQFKTDGIFKRTGDVTIWLTDDEFRAPVKVETSIPLGKVTVELLSAETEKAKPAQTASPPEVRR